MRLVAETTSLLRKLLRPSNYCGVARLCSSAAEDLQDPKASTFFRNDVQCLLQRLTGLDYEKIFRVKKLGQRISTPTYAFLTEEELKEAQEKAHRRALEKLQMPPVMSERSDETKVLDVDDAIQGYDAAKLVFTDITYGVHDRDRIIAVREPDGVLREAKPSERDRLNQIYFPQPYRKVNTPPILEPDNLAVIMKPSRYLYILDRNCCQFEPDHPKYISITKAIFDHVDDGGHYDVLWSTRHYGPMVFHLVWEKKCDDLIAHFLSKGDLRSAKDIVLLYTNVHLESGTTAFVREAGSAVDDISLLRQFIREESNKAAKLNASLESMLEKRESDEVLKEAIDKVHGA